mgnify:CR=1 FL=1
MAHAPFEPRLPTLFVELADGGERRARGRDERQKDPHLPEPALRLDEQSRTIESLCDAN